MAKPPKTTATPVQISKPSVVAGALGGILPGKPNAIIVQQGKLLDFIDGTTQRPETPEEYVRQEIAKSLVREYGYAKKDVVVELTIAVGTRRPRADLVVFHPDAPHTPADARIIVECKAKKVKAEDRDEGVDQLKSYLAVCLSAEWGMWTNGVERFCYRKVVKDKKPIFEEVPDIPAFGKNDEADRPQFGQLKPAASDALMFAFRRCHNRIAGGQGLHKEGAFWELLKLIFCKIYDERASDEVQFYAGARERHGMAGQMKVKARIDQLFTEVKGEYPTIFEPEEQIKLVPDLLAYIVGQLQMYSLLDSDIDVKGHAYEEIVGDNLRGDRGEFFTPRNVCAMAVAMLDPHEDDMILDPACGTGGFLITAMNHVIHQIMAVEEQKWKGSAASAEKAIRARISKFAKTHIVGIDFNPVLVRATKMNMVMNNDGEGGLFQGNTLQSPATWNDGLRARNLLGRVDVLFTNPPFGMNIPIDTPSVLEQYDLGHQWSYDESSDQWTQGAGLQKSQPPEILFVERCVRFLKPGTGRAAIVVPDGILGAPGLGYVREWILTHTRVLASIDLHPDTFQPRTSVQTSLLVLQRKSAEEVAMERAAGRKNDYAAFMALANHIGHDKRGHTTYVRDAKGYEIVEESEEPVKEYDDAGRIVYRLQTTRRKVIDDNTLQLAQAFRKWRSEQD